MMNVMHLADHWGVALIYVLTGRLKWRPMLQQIRESMLHQILHVCVANDTKKIKSSDWLK